MIINNQKKKLLSLLGLFLIVGLFVLAPNAQAGGEWAGKVIGGLIGMIISGLGLILVLVMKVLVSVAQYSNFIASPAVENGWVLVRDVCNMFFVLILLIIAFATILKLENYSYKKWLPKLILMAILINFSKTICGLLIDVAQVVMLTFVNAFKDMAAGNLVTNLGITEVVTLATESDDVGFWAIIGAYILGLIYVSISLVVLVAMLAMLVMRIVMIWIYVVLSPAAYLMSSFPGGQKYASQWWSEFTKNLIVGPVLAFFIWLSFASLQNQSVINDFEVEAAAGGVKGEAALVGIQNSESVSGAVAATKASEPQVVIRFVIAIGMLIGGLKIAQEIGGAAGGMAGKAMQKGTKWGLGAAGAVTGYRYASGVMKSYTSQRRAKREERYKLGAEKMAGVVGTAKKKAAQPVNWAATQVRNKTFIGKAGVEAEKAAQEAKEKRKKIEELQFNFRNHKEIDDWKYDDRKRIWENSSGEKLKDKEFKKDHIDTKVEDLAVEAKAKEDVAAEKRTKQNKTDKWVKYGAPVVGTLLGAVTGGAGGILTGAIAGAATNKLGKNVKHAGEQDLGLASNWRLKQITETKDKMKSDSNENVLAAMDDSSKDAFSRAAAAMEAMDRQIISLNDAENKKKEIRATMGGVKKDGGWKDKKVGSYVENMFDRKYPGGNQIFEALNNPDLKSADPMKKKAAEEKKADAEMKIGSRIEQGTYGLELDTGTLEKSMTYFANTLRNSEFIKQFKSLKDQSKKDAIVSLLEKEGSQGAKEKLASIKDLELAFGPDQEGKEIALGNMSMEDLSDVFRKGTAGQQQAIIDAVSSSSKAPRDRINIFNNAKNSLSGTNPAAQDLRSRLGLIM